jgi:hypothetical protein
MIMDEKFHAILSVALIPQTIALIAEKEGVDDLEALRAFYDSKVYELLANEETKLWHFSPLTLYTMWKQEQETGKIDFPEE